MNAREWKKKIEEERARYLPAPQSFTPLPEPPARDSLILGRDEASNPVALPLPVQFAHTLILGATGSGKSSLLVSLARQVMRSAAGFLLIDPHGSQNGSVYKTLAPIAVESGRVVHLVDFSGPYRIGFNSLARPGDTHSSVIVGNNMDALSIIWEAESFVAKPTIERNLSVILTALVELGLTLCEAMHLIDRADSRGLRRYAIEHIADPYIRSELQRLDELAKNRQRRRDYDQEVVGPANRLARLVRPPALRAMLGQTENCIDFQACMDKGHIILANLSGGSQAYERDADVLGRLFVRSALFHAKRRTSSNPFVFFIDEASRYLTADVPTMLAETRKYNVALFASLQWLSQAGKKDEPMRQALLRGTGTKIVFRVRDAEEAQQLAHTSVPLNLERPVAALAKPTVVGHRRTRLANESTGTNSAVTESEARTDSSARTLSESETEGFARSIVNNEALTEGQTTTEGSNSSKGTGAGESTTEIMIPTDDPTEPIISRIAAGTSSNTTETTGASQSTARNTGKVTSTGTVDTESYALSRGISDTKGVALTRGTARTTGQSATTGTSEALEPIMEVLPTAVHSLQNELYAAGAVLMHLPTATGYVSYVGSRGAVATLFTVPPVHIKPMAPEAFGELRDKVLKANGAIQTGEALRIIEERLPEQTPRETEKKSPRALSPRPKRDRGEKLWE